MRRAYLPIAFRQTIADGLKAQGDPRTEFVALWRDAAWQQRREMTEDARLTAAAQAHAEELRYRELVLREPHGYDLHVDLQGRQPNARVKAHGYPLPDSYEDHLNYVESVAVDHRGAVDALQMLLDSPTHHDHIVGVGDFFRGQTRWGLSFVAPAWWALVTAPPV